MLSLSITACSFCLKKSNSIGNKSAYQLNKPIEISKSSVKEEKIENVFDLFQKFFEENSSIIDDKEEQRVFKCSYINEMVETKDFVMYPILISSGVYGSASEIINVETKKLQYQKNTKDVDLREYYLFVVIPKDNSRVKVQKGMLIFQNIGPYGIKTIITQKLQQYFSKNYKITLICNTIAPSLFIKKVLNANNIKKITMIKNYKSSDGADDYSLGYGQEIKTITKLKFTESKWNQIKESMLYVSGAKDRLFELDNKKYDCVKAIAEIGGRTRTISLNNLENLSIIESIPDDIRDITGNPDKNKLIEYLKKVIKEYLEEMVLTLE